MFSPKERISLRGGTSYQIHFVFINIGFRLEAHADIYEMCGDVVRKIRKVLEACGTFKI